MASKSCGYARVTDNRQNDNKKYKVHMGEVAHGRVPSQKIAQLSLNKSLADIFIPTCRELNSLSIE